MQTAKLFPNGQSQAVRLPKEFRFTGDRVYVQRIGNAVVLLPFQAPWRTLFESLDDFTADFGAEEPA
ncbi:MAG: AbrB/MazE/SpoVT family DNA-binding domain-containing protein [Anaerolineales bacterium]|nr:AbrB/MazE/SpoVT family DNA-binding domain-containing protein [Anaerolineales bacterium]